MRQGEGQLSRLEWSRQEKQGRGALGVQGPSEPGFLLRPVGCGQRRRVIRPQQGQSSWLRPALLLLQAHTPPSYLALPPDLGVSDLR